MIVPHATMQRIVETRQRRLDEGIRGGTCVRAIPAPCVGCGAPGPYCNDRSKQPEDHVALCEACYATQLTFHQLDVLVNG